MPDDKTQNQSNTLPDFNLLRKPLSELADSVSSTTRTINEFNRGLTKLKSIQLEKLISPGETQEGSGDSRQPASIGTSGQVNIKPESVKQVNIQDSIAPPVAVEPAPENVIDATDYLQNNDNRETKTPDRGVNTPTPEKESQLTEPTTIEAAAAELASDEKTPAGKQEEAQQEQQMLPTNNDNNIISQTTNTTTNITNPTNTTNTANSETTDSETTNSNTTNSETTNSNTTNSEDISETSSDTANVESIKTTQQTPPPTQQTSEPNTDTGRETTVEVEKTSLLSKLINKVNTNVKNIQNRQENMGETLLQSVMNQTKENLKQTKETIREKGQSTLQSIKEGWRTGRLGEEPTGKEGLAQASAREVGDAWREQRELDTPLSKLVDSFKALKSGNFSDAIKGSVSAGMQVYETGEKTNEQRSGTKGDTDQESTQDEYNNTQTQNNETVNNITESGDVINQGSQKIKDAVTPQFPKPNSPHAAEYIQTAGENINKGVSEIKNQSETFVKNIENNKIVNFPNQNKSTEGGNDTETTPVDGATQRQAKKIGPDEVKIVNFKELADELAEVLSGQNKNVTTTGTSSSQQVQPAEEDSGGGILDTLGSFFGFGGGSSNKSTKAPKRVNTKPRGGFLKRSMSKLKGFRPGRMLPGILKTGGAIAAGVGISKMVGGDKTPKAPAPKALDAPKTTTKPTPKSTVKPPKPVGIGSKALKLVSRGLPGFGLGQGGMLEPGSDQYKQVFGDQKPKSPLSKPDAVKPAPKPSAPSPAAAPKPSAPSPAAAPKPSAPAAAPKPSAPAAAPKPAAAAAAPKPSAPAPAAAPKPSAPAAAPKPTKGFFGGLWDKTKKMGSSVVSKASKAVSSVKKGITNLSPTKLISKAKNAISGSAGKVLKTVFKVPVIGTALEAVFATLEAKDVLSNPQLTGKEKQKQVGSIIGRSVGGLMGGAIAGVGAQALNVVPGLGLIITPLAYMGGDFIGRMAADALMNNVEGIDSKMGGVAGSILNIDYEKGSVQDEQESTPETSETDPQALEKEIKPVDTSNLAKVAIPDNKTTVTPTDIEAGNSSTPLAQSAPAAVSSITTGTVSASKNKTSTGAPIVANNKTSLTSSPSTGKPLSNNVVSKPTSSTAVAGTVAAGAALASTTATAPQPNPPAPKVNSTQLGQATAITQPPPAVPTTTEQKTPTTEQGNSIGQTESTPVFVKIVPDTETIETSSTVQEKQTDLTGSEQKTTIEPSPSIEPQTLAGKISQTASNVYPSSIIGKVSTTGKNIIDKSKQLLTGKDKETDTKTTEIEPSVDNNTLISKAVQPSGNTLSTAQDKNDNLDSTAIASVPKKPIEPAKPKSFLGKIASGAKSLFTEHPLVKLFRKKEETPGSVSVKPAKSQGLLSKISTGAKATGTKALDKGKYFASQAADLGMGLADKAKQKADELEPGATAKTALETTKKIGVTAAQSGKTLLGKAKQKITEASNSETSEKVVAGTKRLASGAKTTSAAALDKGKYFASQAADLGLSFAGKAKQKAAEVVEKTPSMLSASKTAAAKAAGSVTATARSLPGVMKEKSQTIKQTIDKITTPATTQSVPENKPTGILGNIKEKISNISQKTNNIKSTNDSTKSTSILEKIKDTASTATNRIKETTNNVASSTKDRSSNFIQNTIPLAQKTGTNALAATAAVGEKTKGFMDRLLDDKKEREEKQQEQNSSAPGGTAVITNSSTSNNTTTINRFDTDVVSKWRSQYIDEQHKPGHYSMYS